MLNESQEEIGRKVVEEEAHQQSSPEISTFNDEYLKEKTMPKLKSILKNVGNKNNLVQRRVTYRFEY